MRRLLPFLLLLAAPATCWATPTESEPAPKNGACVYARPATTVAVAEGARFITAGQWWLVAYPGLALMLTVLCFNLLGDGLRDILDPRMRT